MEHSYLEGVRVFLLLCKCEVNQVNPSSSSRCSSSASVFEVGQLWIVEDQEAQNISQNILFTNQSHRIEYSLRANLKNVRRKTQRRIAGKMSFLFSAS